MQTGVTITSTQLSPQSLPPQTTSIQIIQVTLLLAGGHQYQLQLPANSPLLTTLLSLIAAKSQAGKSSSSQLLQIPINQQRQALWFASEDLIGVVTEPPIFTRDRTPVQPPLSCSLATPQTELLPAKFVQIDGFLTPNEREKLLDYALQKQSSFSPTGPGTNTPDYPEHRDSLVLYSSPDFADLMIRRVSSILPDVLRQLEIPSFTVTHIDAQLTAHNHGHYFHIHNDNGSERDATRVLTYVYYFHREPKAFSGGELLLYDTQKVGQNYHKAGQSHILEPRNNRIIFFPSGCLHEVLSVNCPSQQFADSRFTINGWVRR